MEYLDQCPICESQDFEEIISSKDYFLTQEHFNIDTCNSCGIKFTNPRPLAKNIFNYYKSEDYISHSNTSKGLVNKLYKAVRTYTLTRKIQLIRKYKPSGKLLDIGSGSGEFLFTISQNKFTVTGIEPDQKARDFSISKYNLQVFDESFLDKLEPHSFDVITMWHVLEHVYDLSARIEQLSKLLKDDGILIVAVPNSSSYDAKKYGEYWAAYDLPRHIYHFTKKDIWNLFKTHKFEVRKIVPMKFDSFYISMLSEKYKTGSNKYIKAFLVGMISNFLARFTKNNYSSLTYVIKKNIS